MAPRRVQRIALHSRTLHRITSLQRIVWQHLIAWHRAALRIASLYRIPLRLIAFHRITLYHALYHYTALPRITLYRAPMIVSHRTVYRNAGHLVVECPKGKMGMFRHGRDANTAATVAASFGGEQQLAHVPQQLLHV